MGIRAVLKKQLMNVEALGLMTAEDVREFLKSYCQKAHDKFVLISRFNEHHHRIVHGLSSSEQGLNSQQHPAFKDILYAEHSVKVWAQRALN